MLCRRKKTRSLSRKEGTQSGEDATRTSVARGFFLTASPTCLPCASCRRGGQARRACVGEDDKAVAPPGQSRTCPKKRGATSCNRSSSGRQGDPTQANGDQHSESMREGRGGEKRRNVGKGRLSVSIRVGGETCDGGVGDGSAGGAGLLRSPGSAPPAMGDVRPKHAAR